MDWWGGKVEASHGLINFAVIVEKKLSSVSNVQPLEEKAHILVESYFLKVNRI